MAECVLFPLAMFAGVFVLLAWLTGGFRLMYRRDRDRWED